MFKRAKVLLLPSKIIAPAPGYYIDAISMYIHQHVAERGKKELIRHRYYDYQEVPNGQHLYILSSDEEIKEGDWYYTDVISKSVHLADTERLVELAKMYNCKKIIATTDKSLWYTSEMTERGKFEKNLLDKSNSPYPRYEEAINMAWYKPTNVSKVSEAFIKAYIEAYNSGNPIVDVDVEYQKAYNENYKLPRYSDNPSSWYDYILKVDKNNTITIKKIKDSWTREEVVKILHQATDDTCFNPQLLDSWIKQNL